MAEFLKFFVGCFAVLFIGLAASMAPALPGSAPSAEQRLRALAARALDEAGVSWAEATMQGQKAVIAGVAPSRDARDAALDILATSAGPGGALFGGVTRIDARAVTIAPQAPGPAPLSEDIPLDIAASGSVERRADVAPDPLASPFAAPIAEPSPQARSHAACDAQLSRVIAGQSIRFAFARRAPEASSLAGLAALAEILTACPDVHLRITGHTDATGSPARNLRLSENRAAAVADALTGLGVAPDRLEIVGRGDAEPLFDNATAEGRAGNRRIEIAPFRPGAPAEDTTARAAQQE